MSGRVGRIGDRRTFRELAESGHRVRVGPVTVVYLHRQTGPRVAYAVGRRVGSAVVRNKVRRRLREIVRRDADLLESGAYLVVAHPRAAEASFEELSSSLRRALRLVRKEVV
ncbi:MAG: hypothetical protein KatS3mg008_1412 [Acidimicrobiales bacterium]|nr:MAG: hypothetical protein KatS3mg008_1412 [Acidimicrobiales bacterium]